MSRKAKLHRTQPRPKSSDRRVKQRPPVRANRGFSYIQRKGAQRTGKGAFVRFHLTPTLKRLAEGKGDIQAYLQWYGFGRGKITGNLEAEAWAQFGRVYFDNDSNVKEILV